MLNREEGREEKGDGRWKREEGSVIRHKLQSSSCKKSQIINHKSR
jgi:hypothetical protein